MMPESVVRLSAGRTAMSDEMQALCFFAGANSIFVGDTLLTAGNPENDKDMDLFRTAGPAADGAGRLADRHVVACYTNPGIRLPKKLKT